LALLRARGERPRRRAAEECDKVASLHAKLGAPVGDKAYPTRAVLCVTAESAHQMTLWVNRVRSTRPQPAGNVRFAPKAAVRSPTDPALVEWSGENPGPARMLRERLNPGPEWENDQGSQSRMSASPASRHGSTPAGQARCFLFENR